MYNGRSYFIISKLSQQRESINCRREKKIQDDNWIDVRDMVIAIIHRH